MTAAPRRILVIDDDSADVELLRRRLATVPELTFDLQHLGDYRTVQDVAASAPDVVFVDYYLGSHNGLDVVRAVREYDDGLPIVMLTGQGGESVAVECMRSGADDYVNKAEMSAEVLRRALQHAQARAEQRQAEARLQLLQYGIDRASEPVYWLDDSGRLTHANEAACRTLGYERDELLTKTIGDVAPERTPAQWQAVCERLEREGALLREERHRRRDGSSFPVEVNVNCVRYRGRRQICMFVRDLSERKRAEARLREQERQIRHKQRLEVVGTLAGGIAHEFNNLLQIVHGYVDAAMDELPPDGSAYRNLQNVVEAADRAVTITRKLLDFSRLHSTARSENPPPDGERSTLHPNQAVVELSALVRPLLGRQIELTTELDERVGVLNADPVSFQQMLMNLCVNARDAMPDGGTLRICTANVTFAKCAGIRSPDVRRGCYVQISVADTGCGMPPEVMERMFDPFFTTKAVGKGTGLGLAAVLSIVRQHSGFLRVQSRVGEGTTIQVNFPTAPCLAAGESAYPLDDACCEVPPDPYAGDVSADAAPEIVWA